MTEISSPRIYRVDKFVVPIEAREEFLSPIRRTHDLLEDQPGFIQDFVLEQSGESGEFTLVTIVEWENQKAIENAQDTITAMHERMGFDPQEMISKLGIESDMGTYTRIEEK